MKKRILVKAICNRESGIHLSISAYSPLTLTRNKNFYPSHLPWKYLGVQNVLAVEGVFMIRKYVKLERNVSYPFLLLIF